MTKNYKIVRNLCCFRWKSLPSGCNITGIIVRRIDFCRGNHSASSRLDCEKELPRPVSDASSHQNILHLIWPVHYYVWTLLHLGCPLELRCWPNLHSSLLQEISSRIPLHVVYKDNRWLSTGTNNNCVPATTAWTASLRPDPRRSKEEVCEINRLKAVDNMIAKVSDLFGEKARCARFPIDARSYFSEP